MQFHFTLQQSTDFTYWKQWPKFFNPINLNPITISHIRKRTSRASIYSVHFWLLYWSSIIHIGIKRHFPIIIWNIITQWWTWTLIKWLLHNVYGPHYFSRHYQVYDCIRRRYKYIKNITGTNGSRRAIARELKPYNKHFAFIPFGQYPISD